MTIYSAMNPPMIDGKLLVTPCLEIMALSKTPKAEASAGYVRFYEAFARRYGPYLTSYQLSDTNRWKRVLPKDLIKVPYWFADARSLQAPLLGIVMHTQPVANEPRPPLFEMLFEHGYPEYPRGMFRVALPIDCLDESPEQVLMLVDEAMAEFPVHWGTAGYSFYWNDTDSEAEEHAARWLGGRLARHPGLAPGRLLSWGACVEDGVANIGWLTFIGDTLIRELGGRDALTTAARDTGIELRSYVRGVALQTGPRPEIGDVNRRDTLPLHHEVGRILEPVFAPDDVLEKIQVTGIKDPDRRLEWLRRFLP